MSDVLPLDCEVKLSIHTFQRAKISTKVEPQNISHHWNICLYIIGKKVNQVCSISFSV